MLPTQERSLIAPCCRAGAHRAPAQRRGWNVAAPVVSLAIWVLMPKCPICFASYVALWTGLGLSFTQASVLRLSLLSLSGGLLGVLILRQILLRLQARGRLAALGDRAEPGD